MKIISVKQTKQTKQTEQMEIPSNFPVWLHEELVKETKNFTTLSNFNEKQFEIITDWAHATSPNLMGIGLPAAYNLARQWYNKNLTKQYKTNNVVYKWKDGWKIVELPESSYSSRTDPQKHIYDIEIERELMQTNEKDEYDKPIYEAFYDNRGFLENNERPREGAAQIIYSLRDPDNIPKATIEIRYNKKSPRRLYLHQVFTNEEKIENPDSWQTEYLHPRKNYIENFFDYLKSKGYLFMPVDSQGSDDVKADKLEETVTEDQFGVPYEVWGVGGSNSNYFDSLKEAYYSGGDSSCWNKSKAFSVADHLIDYAEKRGELDILGGALEGYSVEKKDIKGKTTVIHEGFKNLAWNWWIETGENMRFKHPNPKDEPDEKDFIIEPQTKTEQPELKNMPKPKEIIDKKAYQQALKEYKEALELYERERDEAERQFEPYQFQNYVYEKIQEAKARQAKFSDQLKKKADMRTKITKIAKTADISDRLPNGEQMALYVQTLKRYLIDNPKICDEWKDLIEKLPSPRKIRQDFSLQEIKLLYETVGYLWKNITKTDLIPEEELIRAPETLSGNYLMIANGILLKGINVHDIIRRNTQLICSLLNIGGMTIQEYLGRKPNDLVKFILKNGALRLFITEDKRFYAQCSPECYAKWSKNKIRKLDFKKKVVKLIDFRVEYKGWSSGISVIL